MTVFSFKRHTYIKLDNNFVLTVQSRKEGDKTSWEIIAIPTNISEEFHIILENDLTEEEAYKLHWIICRVQQGCVFIDDELEAIRSDCWFDQNSYDKEKRKWI